MGTNYYRAKTGEHIGKKSAGWSFQFCDNYGFKSFGDVIEWVSEQLIVDEYQQYIPHSVFWDMVISSKKDRHHTIPEYIPLRRLNGYDFTVGEFC